MTWPDTSDSVASQELEETKLNDTFAQQVDLEAAFGASDFNDFNDSFAHPFGPPIENGQKVSQMDTGGQPSKKKSKPEGIEQKMDFLIKSVADVCGRFEAAQKETNRDLQLVKNDVDTLKVNQVMSANAIADLNKEIDRLHELVKRKQKELVRDVENMFKEKHNIILWDRQEKTLKHFGKAPENVHKYALNIIKTYLPDILACDFKAKKLRNKDNKEDPDKFRLMICFNSIGDAEKFKGRIIASGDVKCRQGMSALKRQQAAEVYEKAERLNKLAPKDTPFLYKAVFQTKIGVFKKDDPTHLTDIMDDPFPVKALEGRVTNSNLRFQRFSKQAEHPLFGDMTDMKNLSQMNSLPTPFKTPEKEKKISPGIGTLKEIRRVTTDPPRERDRIPPRFCSRDEEERHERRHGDRYSDRRRSNSHRYKDHGRSPPHRSPHHRRGGSRQSEKSNNGTPGYKRGGRSFPSFQRGGQRGKFDPHQRRITDYVRFVKRVAKDKDGVLKNVNDLKDEHGDLVHERLGETSRKGLALTIFQQEEELKELRRQLHEK